MLGPDADALLEKCRASVDSKRASALLARGFLLGHAVDNWHSRSIWVVSRADPQYPRRLKTVMREDAPVILYGCGDAALLNDGGLAVVGSRNADASTLACAEDAGRLAAAAGLGLVSGGARGIDQAAMRGAFQANGAVIGVLADSLARAALAPENRDALRQGRTVLVSAQDPSAGFNVGFAMQRNKYIYAFSNAAFVVNSDYQKGGTWAGAVEQLERYKYVPVFVRNRTGNGEPTGRGNDALIKRGAIPWPCPESAEQLAEAMAKAAACHATAQIRQDVLPMQGDILEDLQPQPPSSENAAPASQQQKEFDPDEPVLPPDAQPEFALTLEEPPVPYASGAPVSAKDNPFRDKTVETTALEGSPAHTLLECAEQLLKTGLLLPKTDAEVAEYLAITKPQAKAWLEILAKKGTIVKTKKPIRYHSADK